MEHSSKKGQQFDTCGLFFPVINWKARKLQKLVAQRRHKVNPTDFFPYSYLMTLGL